MSTLLASTVKLPVSSGVSIGDRDEVLSTSGIRPNDRLFAVLVIFSVSTELQGHSGLDPSVDYPKPHSSVVTLGDNVILEDW